MLLADLDLPAVEPLPLPTVQEVLDHCDGTRLRPVDVARLDRVRVVIGHHARDPWGTVNGLTWDQGAWRCGTSRCHAGWTAELDNIHWTDPDNPMGVRVNVADGPVPVMAYARWALGIDKNDAYDLFAGGNGFDDIDAITDRIIRAALRRVDV